MSSKAAGQDQKLKEKLLESELERMMAKEVQMRDLYSELVRRVENAHINKRVMAIRDDEERHIGYVRIIMSLIGVGK